MQATLFISVLDNRLFPIYFNEVVNYSLHVE